MRRLAWCALALAAACGSPSTAPPPGPLDQIRLPSGLAVHHGRLLALSTNNDLTFNADTGGSLIALGVDPALSTSIVGAAQVRSFGGALALARADLPAGDVPEAEACAPDLSTPLAVFGTRGASTLDLVAIDPQDRPRCDLPESRCGISVSGRFADPFAVAVACGGARPKAFFGYLTAQSSEAWIAQLDLVTRDVTNVLVGLGAIHGLAYDRSRDRLFLLGAATATPTPLRWLDLAGCTLGATPEAGGCTLGSATLPIVAGSYGLELRSMAFANPAVPGVRRAAGEPVRAYATGLLYDTVAAATVGFRNTDFGGVLVVMDLVDDARGGVDVQIVAIHEIPRGPREIRVLPRFAGWASARRDVVALVSVDEGTLTVFDDETQSTSLIRTDERTGAPLLGHEPYGLAVDPVILGTNAARVWVGSYRESFVTPLNVTLDPETSVTFAGGRPTRISGANP